MADAKRILIVDDDSLVRQTLADMMQDLGHVADQAGSVKSALACLAEKPYDLLLTDILMPEEDGLELLRKAKTMPGNMQIIAMSGGGYQDSGFYLDLARSLGASATIKKPVTLEVLQAVLRDTDPS